LLNVLAFLVDLEPGQAKLLEKICAGPLISSDKLKTAGALAVPVKAKRRPVSHRGQTCSIISTNQGEEYF
jgi:hypothetical protein